mgnify:CR=1 FL=1
MIHPGELVQLVSPKGKRYLRVFDPQETLNTHDGQLQMALVGETGYGHCVKTHIGRSYRIVKPTLYDLLKNIKRKTQIIYPKEIGYILLKLGVGPGSRIIEAGSGSGSLSIALSWYVADHGKVYTYERRPEFFALCAENLAQVGLTHRVEQFEQNISEGFLQTDVDALFLDVRTPWDYLQQAAAALRVGAPIGFLLPTTNQVSELLWALEQASFADTEVLEIMLRRYKPVPDRLRPDDRMVAHTGFLVFARKSTQKDHDNELEPDFEDLA